MADKQVTDISAEMTASDMAEEELVARVAWCYYHDGLTQHDIGERLGLPRLKISRRTNLVKSKKFPERLAETMKKYLKGLLTSTQVANNLKEMAKDIVSAHAEEVKRWD